jgi:hypothetical protein
MENKSVFKEVIKKIEHLLRDSYELTTVELEDCVKKRFTEEHVKVEKK